MHRSLDRQSTDSIPVHYVNELQRCKASFGFSNRDLAEITGTSHSQVHRWMKGDAEPSGLQEAIITALREWADSDQDNDKELFLYALKVDGHGEVLRLLFCQGHEQTTAQNGAQARQK